MSSVRRAHLLDISALIALLSLMYDEVEAGYPEPNWEKVGSNILTAISRGVVFVAEKDNKVVGSIGGILTTEWFADEHFLGDLWYYVAPDYRNSRIGIELLKAFKKAGEQGGYRVKVGHVYGKDIDRKDALYERLGFSQLGTLFVNR